MAYTLTLKLLADIGTQLERIRSEHGLIIPFLSLEDIIVIETRRNEGEGEGEGETDDASDELTFVFMNAEKLMQEPGVEQILSSSYGIPLQKYLLYLYTLTNNIAKGSHVFARLLKIYS